MASDVFTLLILLILLLTLDFILAALCLAIVLVYTRFSPRRSRSIQKRIRNIGTQARQEVRQTAEAYLTQAMALFPSQSLWQVVKRGIVTLVVDFSLLLPVSVVVNALQLNHPPPWWETLFYFTTLIAVPVYSLYSILWGIIQWLRNRRSPR